MNAKCPICGRRNPFPSDGEVRCWNCHRLIFTPEDRQESLILTSAIVKDREINLDSAIQVNQ